MPSRLRLISIGMMGFCRNYMRTLTNWKWDNRLRQGSSIGTSPSEFKHKSEKHCTRCWGQRAYTDCRILRLRNSECWTMRFLRIRRRRGIKLQKTLTSTTHSKRMLMIWYMSWRKTKTMMRLTSWEPSLGISRILRNTKQTIQNGQMRKIISWVTT